MNSIQQINRQIKTKISNQFSRNLGWLGLAEVVYRILGLGLVVIIARFLTPYDFGLAAILIAVREFAITFTNVGIDAKIIQAKENELETLCNSGYWLNWTIFGTLFILQFLVAFLISWFYQNNDIILPIIVSGVAYLFRPIGAIQKSLIQRENRFKITGITDTIQYSLASIFAAILAILGMGVWAFALPVVFAAILEVFIYYIVHPWRPTTGFTTQRWQEIFNFGKNILGVALLKTLRNNLDYLLVGHLIGITGLGLYYFGFHAGLGISLIIINAINSVILPRLYAAIPEWSKFKKRYLSSLKTIGFIIIPFVLLQSILAPLYVPIIFGEQWREAIPILILICLSAISRPFANTASQLLIVIGQPHIDLRWNILFTFIFIVALIIGINWQIIGVAASVLLVHLICLPLFTLWATRFVFLRLGGVGSRE